MLAKLNQLISDGEGLATEFKRCESELSSSVYETVSAFSNRYGGYILLGVEDDGTVSGVNPKTVSNMKKDFVSSLNNSYRFAPTIFLALEEAEIDGKTILSSTPEKCNYFDTKIEYIIENVANWMKYGFIFD